MIVPALRLEFARLMALSIACLATVGCGETEHITRYAVPKQAETPAGSKAMTDRGDVSPRSALPSSAWFLKLTGPSEAVAAIEDQFLALVESTSISGGTLEWKLPEGWKQQSGSGMRFATLTIDTTDPPLEVSAIKLPYRGDRDDYLRDNINRWRGQVGLKPTTGADWRTTAESAGEVRPLEVADQDVTFVDLHGKTEEFSNARMLAAILLPTSPASARPAAPMTPPAASAAPPSKADGPLTYDVPEGWKPGRTSMMRVAAFDVADGDKKAEITVISAGGDVLDNVNRWRGQVMLEPWTDDELKQHAKELTVDGKTATYVNLAGSAQTILAAMLPTGQQSWFFKLTGNPELAKREEPKFQAFVESVKVK